ncbi:MAG: ABC transporter substrate-binding protein, partial [Liquorilactobacillus ghanensis]
MNFKRRIQFLFSSLTVLALGIALAGCSSSKSSTAPNNKVTHITYWHVNAQTQGGAAVNTLVKNFNKTHKNIK